MLDFDYVSNKESYSVKCVIEPRQTKNTMDPFFFGNESILMPIYNNFSDAIENNQFDVFFMNLSKKYENDENKIYLINQIIRVDEKFFLHVSTFNHDRLNLRWTS